jgi:chromosome segregation ATPase
VSVPERADVEALLARQVVYDGEDYTRQGLAALVQGYATKHQAGVKTLDELSKAHGDLSREMTAELVEQKSAWEHLSNLLTLKGVGANLQGLLEKIPVLGAIVPDRPLHVLLAEKVEVAQRRTSEVGHYLDRIQEQTQELQQDVAKLQKRMVMAARNEEAAALYVLELQRALQAAERDLAGAADPASAQARELEAAVSSLKHRIWEHGAKLRLYSTAENRLAGIIQMNNNFLEILRNLHGNMQSLYEAGNEVLSDLEGNLAALASSAKASELSIDLQKAMESLRTSVNKVAVLASETSLYLTQNVDRMTREMRVYDEATTKLVEDNLRAEREVQEQRINDTIALAEAELRSFSEARGGAPRRPSG